MDRDALSRQWAATFDETVVITIDGHEARLDRLLATLPIDASLLRIDRGPRGYDVRTGQPETNHHVIVGGRHQRIVEAARRDGRRNVCVLEDDAEFTVDDGRALTAALRWAAAHEDRWDLFYLGFMAPLLSRCAWVAPHVVRPSRPIFAHAVCYHRRSFDDVLAVDLRGDHRSQLFRTVERVFSPRGRSTAYHRDGVGALDCWLSVSPLRRYAAHPIQVVQTSPPPDTARDWRRFSLSAYDVHATPRLLVRSALATHYALWTLPPAALLAALLAGW